jgi:hypothetical protein
MVDLARKAVWRKPFDQISSPFDERLKPPSLRRTAIHGIDMWEPSETFSDDLSPPAPRVDLRRDATGRSGVQYFTQCQFRSPVAKPPTGEQ